HTTHSTLPRPMLGISRAAFDAFLLDQATAAGAQIMQPARVEHIDDTRGDGVRLIVRDLHRNTIDELVSSCVLLADGKSSLIGSSTTLTGDLGFKFHWSGFASAGNVIAMYV